MTEEETIVSHENPVFKCPICNAWIYLIGINERCPNCKLRYFFDKRRLERLAKTKKRTIKACAV